MILKKLLSKMLFNLAIRKANNRWKSTGRRHFVLMDEKANLLVVDNSFIKQYNKINKNKKIDNVKLMEMALYATPGGTYFKRKL